MLNNLRINTGHASYSTSKINLTGELIEYRQTLIWL